MDLLNELLSRALVDDSPATLTRLHTALVSRRTAFSELLKERPREERLKKDLEVGRVTIDGQQLQANEAFCKGVLKVADLLSLNEARAASLYSRALKERTRFGDASDIETCVYLHYSERENTLRCLEAMMQFQASNVPAESQRIVSLFLAEFLPANSRSQTHSIPSRLIALLISLKEVILVINPTDKLLLSRIARERIYVASVLMLFAQQHGLNASETTELLAMLQTLDPDDHVLPYAVSVALAQLDSARRLVLDAASYSAIKDALNSGRWTDGKLKGVLAVAWMLFLDSHHSILDQSLRSVAMQDLDSMKRSWFTQFGADPDVYGRLKSCAALEPCAVSQSPLAKLLAGLSINIKDIRDDISCRCIAVVESLVRNLIVRLRRYFRQVIAADQDLVNAQEAQAEHLGSTGQGFSLLLPRETGWEALLSLITSLYAGRPDAAADWLSQGDLFSFLKMSSEVWTPRFIVAFLQLLTAIASGPICALQVHEILNNEYACEFGQLLWSTFFRTINSYTERFQHAVPAVELQQREAQLISSFLGLLSAVARFSPTARRVLCENQNFRALHTLFLFLVARVNVEIKAALLNAIASFCHPSDEGAEILLEIWQLLEQSQIVPTLANAPTQLAGSQSSNQQSEGILYDFREIETSLETYPETRAFLNLMLALLSNSNSAMIVSLYETLGSPERVGGVRPYVRFVVDEILLRISEKPFADQSEKWQITSCCLRLVELAVLQYDISELQLSLDEDKASIDKPVASVNQSMQFARSARSMAMQPGFEIYSRVLQGSRLTNALFTLLHQGVEQLEAPADALEEPVSNSIASMLRTFLVIFENQRIFLELLVPILIEQRDSAWLNVPISMVTFDQLLAYNKKTVADVAFLVTSSNSELVLLSTNALIHLTSSPVFNLVEVGSLGSMNRLTAILIGSENSNRILQGFVDRLELDDSDQSLYADEDDNLNSITLGATPNSVSGNTNFGWQPSSSSVRCAILDLLLANIKNVPAPNLAHFLLGFDCHRDLALTEFFDPTSANARLNCFHTILSLLSRGMPQSVGDYSEQGHLRLLNDGQLPLSMTNPILSEKCYHLIHSLCSDHKTGTPVMRYLRTHEDFFLRQLNAIRVPRQLPNDTNSNQLTAQLHEQAWLMKIIALELHTTRLSDQRSHTIRLLNRLVGITEMDGAQRNAFSADAYGSIGESTGFDYDQPLAKLLDVLKSMDFNELERLPIEDNLLASKINVGSFVRMDSCNVEQFDIRSIYLVLVSMMLQLEKTQGSASVDAITLGRENIKAFMGTLLETNQSHRLSNARFATSVAWSLLVRTAMYECFELIPAEIRELRHFELLTGLLQKLSQSTCSMAIGKAMSEVVTSLMSRLQQDSEIQSIFNRDTPYSMDPNKLDSWQHGILRGILDGILVPGTSAAMRGNYFTALITYMHYVRPKKSASGDSTGGTQSASANGFLASLSIINSYGDRLIEVICRDASDGELVWQTVAFATLSNLADLCNLESNLRGSKFNPILDFLVKRNFLSHFVKSIKSIDDVNLVALLNGSSGNLTSKYLFDLKMALLLKVSESKVGADRLLNASVFETLSEVSFIRQRPDYGGDDTSDEKELYHDVLFSVLQLILSMLGQFQPSHSGVRSKFELFIGSHRDVFAVILRDKLHTLTLSSLNQVRLLTGILAWSKGDNKLLINHLSGPGESSYDDLMYQLLHKYVLGEDWSSKVAPSTDLEVEKTRELPSKALASSRTVSEFAREVEMQGELIVQQLLFYWIDRYQTPSNTSRVGGQTDREGILAIMSPEVRDKMLEQLSNLLRTFVAKQSQTTQHLKNIQFKIADITQVSTDEINDIAESFNPVLFEELSPSQRQMIALRDLKETLCQVNGHVLRLQCLTEMVTLFLIQIGAWSKKSASIFSSVKPVLEKQLHLTEKVFNMFSFLVNSGLLICVFDLGF